MEVLHKPLTICWVPLPWLCIILFHPGEIDPCGNGCGRPVLNLNLPEELLEGGWKQLLGEMKLSHPEQCQGVSWGS